VSLEEAFLRDVVAHPDEDAPRLAYADWLQEQGDPVRQARGEFIAVQCAIRRDEQRGQYRKEMKKRQRELSVGLRTTWLPETTVTGPRHKVEFSRGFVETVQLDGEGCPLEDFLARAAELFRREPAIRRVCVAPSTVERHPDLMPRLLALPELPRLLKLTLEENRLGPAQLRALGAPALRGLRRLVLNDNQLGDEGATVLAGLDSLAELEALVLERSWIIDGGIFLSRSPHLRRLLYLGLSDNAVSNRTLRGLATATGLDSLKTLALADCEISEQGARALTAGPLLDRLPKLDLARNRLGDEGAAALAASAHLAGVRELNLSWNGIDDGGMAELARSRHVGGLEVLAVTGNPFGEAGGRALATSPHLRRLRALHLADEVDDWRTGRVVAFLEAARLPALVELNLNGYLHLTGYHRLMNVLPALQLSPLLRQLRCLRMNGTGNDEIGSFLLKSSVAANLQELELSPRSFSAEMWQTLKDHFGDRLRHE
jgi:uncharacterized protein (TIGR02996 family)